MQAFELPARIDNAITNSCLTHPAVWACDAATLAPLLLNYAQINVSNARRDAVPCDAEAA